MADGRTLDPERLLESLSRHRVDYVVIGGVAVQAYGHAWMKAAAAQFRDRPEAKRRQDLDDIAVLERLRSGAGPSGDPWKTQL